MVTRPATTRSDLVDPTVIGAVALLAVNDHVLKGRGWLPGWLTGKLSDLAGLYFFPVLLVVLAESLGRRRRPARSLTAAAATVLTGLVFAALKTSPWLADLVNRLVVVARDPGDLVALPVLVASHRYLTRRVPARVAPRWVQAATVTLSAHSAFRTREASDALIGAALDHCRRIAAGG